MISICFVVEKGVNKLIQLLESGLLSILSVKCPKIRHSYTASKPIVDLSPL
jgi:hypothetical protein